MNAIDSHSLAQVLWPLAEKMAAVHREASSGRLVVTSENGVREFIFVNGELRAARSSFDGERLGSWLVNAGVISDDDVALGLLAQVKDNASPLGHQLVRRGLVEQDDLERELQALALSIVERCAAEDPTDVEFIEGGTQEQPDTLLATSTSRLILAAARVHKDEAGMLARLGSLERPARLAAPLESIMFDGGFTMAELSALQRVESAPVVADLEWMMSSDPSQLIPALYALVLAGYMVIGEAPEPRRFVAKGGLSKAVTATFDTAPSPDQPDTISAGLSAEAAAIFERCLELVRVGNVPEAFQRLERLCDVDPRPIHLVRLARFMREHEVAPRRILEILQKALEKDGNLAEGWFELALFWHRNRSPERERKALTRVLHLEPNHHDARKMIDEL